MYLIIHTQLNIKVDLGLVLQQHSTTLVYLKPQGNNLTVFKHSLTQHV